MVIQAIFLFNRFRVSKIMQFDISPPDLGTKLRGGWSWDIFASGVVTGSDAEALQELIVQNNIPSGSEIYLNSGGGSALGGVSLGRVLREYQLIAHVGQKGRSENGFQFSEPGSCASAAALAFLGGEYRFVSSGSKYGVHQFSLGDPSPDDAAAAQRLSSSIIEYIRSMDVDIELFSISSEVAPNDILFLPTKTLARLNVSNNGFKKASWSIESMDGALYLKGSRESIFGGHKYMVVFPAGCPPYLHVNFYGGKQVEDALVMDHDWLAFDEELVPSRDYRMARYNADGYLNAMYFLPPALLEKYSSTKTVGFGLQFSPDAAMFLGFNNLPFEQGAAKLPGLISIHAHGRNP